MKLHHLRNVVAVVERGSLRAAAKQLGLAQPAMSRSIRELERELGVTLFERHKFGMTLTPAGEIFVRRAKSMQNEFQRTLDEIAQFKGKDRGSISIGLSTVGHLVILQKIIEPFRRRYPNVRLNIIEGAFPNLETEIRDGLIDLYYGPVSRGFTDPALIIDQLFENGRIIVARRNHPLRAATSLEELVGAAWVTVPVEIDTDNEVHSYFEAAGLPKPHIAMKATSGMSLITIIASSDLLAPLPQQWLEFISTTSLIEQLPIRAIPNAPRICAVRRANVPLTPTAEYLNDLALRAVTIHVRSRRTGERDLADRAI